MKLHLAVLMGILCGCEKTQPNMEKAEIDMHKALHKARMESAPSSDPPAQTAESVKLDNTLKRVEFELRSELNQK